MYPRPQLEQPWVASLFVTNFQNEFLMHFFTLKECHTNGDALFVSSSLLHTKTIIITYNDYYTMKNMQASKYMIIN